MKLIFIIIFSTLCVAQTIEDFILVQKDGTRIVGEKGSVKNNDFEGIDKKGIAFKTSVDEIDKLYVATQSKAVPIGMLGLIAGALTGLSLDYDRYNYEFRGDTGVIVGCALFGGLIGALIGSNMFSWELIDLKSQKNIGYKQIYPEHTLNIKLNIRM
ncbi:MAG: hypothetical protein WC209_16990 [Ignavibacteriaceae bacterium]|jgi:hypothetical protein